MPFIYLNCTLHFLEHFDRIITKKKNDQTNEIWTNRWRNDSFGQNTILKVCKSPSNTKQQNHKMHRRKISLSLWTYQTGLRFQCANVYQMQ